MRLALTRAVSPTIGECELSHVARRPIDSGRAQRQHAIYVETLIDAGWAVLTLPADERHPDAVFVEDTVVVVDEIAVIARPGAESRRGETSVVAEALRPWRTLATIDAPGTLDGGDVLRIGKRIWVGVGARTNDAGAAQLADHLAPFGYRVTCVPIRSCLHLKTAVTGAAEGTVVVNPEWIDKELFGDLRVVEIDASEPFGANVLDLGDRTIVAATHHRTRERLRRAGISTVTVPADELAKAEGGLTCGSVLIDTDP